MEVVTEEEKNKYKLNMKWGKQPKESLERHLS